MIDKHFINRRKSCASHRYRQGQVQGHFVQCLHYNAHLLYLYKCLYTPKVSNNHCSTHIVYLVNDYYEIIENSVFLFAFIYNKRNINYGGR